jgi:hypothetical protein
MIDCGDRLRESENIPVNVSEIGLTVAPGTILRTEGRLKAV